MKQISIPEAALLEQAAEEAMEFAHACLKYARIKRGENPTPVSEEDAQEQVILEFGDVETVMAQMVRLPWWQWKTFFGQIDYKTRRWEERTNCQKKSES